MPRKSGTVVEQNFTKGLITEASGLNFPENAATESWNVVYDRNGQVYRRLGFDVESEDTALAYDPEIGVIYEFLWRAVARTGLFTFLVIQLGPSILLYKLEGDVALGETAPLSVSLLDYQVPGSQPVKDTLASFASGQGRLFVTHPSCDPVVIEFDDLTNTLTESSITIKIRDFEGVEDGLEIDERPTTLSNLHLYNLKNQGWHTPVRCANP